MPTRSYKMAVKWEPFRGCGPVSRLITDLPHAMTTVSVQTLICIGLALYLGTLIYSILDFVSRTVTRRNLRRDLSRQYQCQPIQTKYPHKDPILGLDLFISNALAAWQHRFLETVNRRHDGSGETYQLNILGTVGECTLSITANSTL